MKSVSRLLFIVFLIIASNNAMSNTQLTVQDPHQTWRYDTGSIEESILTVKPAGAFVEYSLTLSFSSRGTYMNNYYDSLEVQYFFDLPENSFIVDAWLWIGDTIMKAKLLDKGQATIIYEGIVKRRRDPLILYKQSQTSYEMRIYPMAGNETRKARITWLTPLNWTETGVLTNLPLHLLNCAKNKPAESIVMLYNDAVWKNASIANNQNLVINDDYWNEFGACKSVAIPYNMLNSSLTIKYDSPAKNGVFVSAYEEKANEGYYNMVIQPSKALAFYAKKKVLFLVDYDAAKSDLTRQEVIDNLKSAIINNFTPADSFNIIFSKNDAEPVSQSWVGGTPEEINSLFNSLPQNILSYYSTLPSLLIKGAKYVKSKIYDCTIFLIANSDAFGSNKLANPLIEEYTAEIGKYVQFNVADYSTKYRIIYWISNRNYSGNEYLYSYLSVSSGGFYTDITKYGNSFTNLMNSSFKMFDGQINSFEIYPATNNGFCYGRYLLSGSNQSYSATPIVQVGKWVGEMPFSITATGFYKNNSFSKKIDINKEEVYWSDMRTRQSWVGVYLKTLESGTKTNDITAEIIRTSIEHRVLSLYTAFLALEPERQKKEDEDATSVDELTVSGLVQVKYYPNPFTEKIRFNIASSEKETIIDIIEIYNVMGDKVKTLMPSMDSSSLDFEWDGTDESGNKLLSGVYIVRIKTSRGIFNIRVILTGN